MKIMSIVGARPQFIKAAAFSRVSAKRRGIREILVHTGQHFDTSMSDVFFDTMDIPRPAYNLAVNSLSHGAMTGRMLEKIEALVMKEKPDVVLVYGDTNSTLAGALAARKLHVKVGHVEAGLRSFNMEMPEEVNRILTDRISDYLYCPTPTAVENLHREGFDRFDAEIVRTGDIMLDAALYYAVQSSRKADLPPLPPGKFALCTVHRAENTDSPERMDAILEGLRKVHGDLPVVMPLHPRTRRVLSDRGVDPRLWMLPPVGYFEMLELLKNCSLVLTDSGGLQKEAYFFHKHCVTLRDQTEWTELVEGGFNVLARADAEDIYLKAGEMLEKESDFTRGLYGTGRAAEEILDHLEGEIGRAHV